MNKTITASAAMGPYCHAKQAGNALYTSGELGLIPATGELAEEVETQARSCVQVADLPSGALFKIEAVAVK